MYIYIISSKVFGENIHKIIHSEDKREVVDMIKSHQLLYRDQFDIEELEVDINEKGYDDFLKNIDCNKSLDRFYKFESNFEEFKKLLEAYCIFNNKLSKFSPEKNCVEQAEKSETLKSYVKSNNASFIFKKDEYAKEDNYIKTFADVDLKNSRVSYIYDDKADTLLSKQLFGDKLKKRSEMYTKEDILNDVDLLRDDDHTNVLKNIKKMSVEEWKEQSDKMNSKVNNDGATANLLYKLNVDDEDEDEEDEEDGVDGVDDADGVDEVKSKKDKKRKIIAFVNNIFLGKKVIYFDDDEIKTIDHDDFNEFKILEKFLIYNNDIVIKMIMYNIQRYNEKNKELTIQNISSVIKKAESAVVDSSDEEEEEKNIGVKKYFYSDITFNMPPSKLIQNFMNEHCTHVSGNKEQAKVVFNKFSDYIYENNLTNMSDINKTIFTKTLKKHYLYRRFSSGMYWVDMKLID